MSRSLTIRKPNADEVHQLHQWLEQPLQSWQRRRAEVLLLYAADGSISSIAQNSSKSIATPSLPISTSSRGTAYRR